MSPLLWDGPMVDAHQHFWEPAVNDHPWLRPGVLIPFRYGDYTGIKRRYLPDDYRVDARGHDVRRTVYVETEWNPADPIGETRYATGLAESFGWPNAIVAQAWLDRADVEDVLAAQAAFPLVRSVRHKPGGPASLAELGSCFSLMSDPVWRAGFAELERHGLHFDLQTPWWNLHEAIRLAADFPGVLLILNHAGLPPAGDLGGWRSAMAAFAECPNVVVKVSGLGGAWTSGVAEYVIRFVLDVFGADRAMFGSNFPVDSLCTSFDKIASGMKAALIGVSVYDQEKFFAGTASRVYALN